MPGLVIYAGLEGSVSIFDPLQNKWQGPVRQDLPSDAAFLFTSGDVWNGLESEEGVRVCNGLILDWVSWQKGKESPFDQLQLCLASLSEDQSSPLKPGPPKRVSPFESTEYPTIAMPNGDLVPAKQWSAGIRRIVAFAYMLVWAAKSHQEAAELRGAETPKQLLVLFDELESHLHPRWQRRILPALLETISGLETFKGWEVQFVAATHSPLVLASIEPTFNEDTDQLFVLELDQATREVRLDAKAWAKEGDATNWLVSDAFHLHQARSIEAEQAIEDAEAWMRGEATSKFATVEAIHAELVRVLPGQDHFWPRWVVSREKNGKH